MSVLRRSNDTFEFVFRLQCDELGQVPSLILNWDPDEGYWFDSWATGHEGPDEDVALLPEVARLLAALPAFVDRLNLRFP
jgi:hypothetical protein